MKVTKAMKIAKRNRKAKDHYDIKSRGYTDAQYEAMKNAPKWVGENYITQYLDAEDDVIMKGVTVKGVDEIFILKSHTT